MEQQIEEVEEKSMSQSMLARALVLGVGGAGCRIVEMLAETLSDTEQACLDLRVLDSDFLALKQIRKVRKYMVCGFTLHGLGCGSDLGEGRMAVKKEKEHLEQFISGYPILIVVVGMGGGMGASLAEVLVVIANKSKTFSVVFAVNPFECEGNARLTRSLMCVNKVAERASLVIRLSNQWLVELVRENANFAKLFEKGNQLIAYAIRVLGRCLFGQRVLPLDLGMLAHTFIPGKEREPSVFMVAETDVLQGTVDALWKEFEAHPWWNGGGYLRRASRVLVLFDAGTDFSPMLVDEFKAKLMDTNAEMAYVVGGSLNNNLRPSVVRVVMILSLDRIPADNPSETEKKILLNSLPKIDPNAEIPKPPAQVVPPAPDLSEEQKNSLRNVANPGLLGMFRNKNGKRKSKNHALGQLELVDVVLVCEGCFDGTYRTIYQGVDLDTPTYLRENQGQYIPFQTNN